MDSNKIKSLAHLLRENGDKILNSGFQLVLSGKLRLSFINYNTCIQL